MGVILGGNGMIANGPVDTFPTRFSVCGEFDASEATLTVAVRVPVALEAGEKVTLRPQKCVPTEQFEGLPAFTENSAAFGPVKTGNPVVTGNSAVESVPGVDNAAFCAELVVPGPCPLNVRVEGTKEAESKVPEAPLSAIP